MLQPEIAELIAARNQEMELRIVEGAKNRTSFLHDPAIKAHDIRADLHGALRLGHKIQECRRISSGIERDRPQVLTGDQRAVDELGERERFKRGASVIGFLGFERSRIARRSGVAN